MVVAGRIYRVILHFHFLEGEDFDEVREVYRLATEFLENDELEDTKRLFDDSFSVKSTFRGDNTDESVLSPEMFQLALFVEKKGAQRLAEKQSLGSLDKEGRLRGKGNIEAPLRSSYRLRRRI